MEQKPIRKILHIDGMTCTNCEIRIENALRQLEGMVEAKALYSSSNVYVTYDVTRLGRREIVETIERVGYEVKGGAETPKINTSKKEKQIHENENKMGMGQLLGIGIILFALYIIIKNTIGFNTIPEITPSVGYGMLFIVGVLTSLHCVAMCGGINLSVCMGAGVKENQGGSSGKFAKLKPGALYNLGRVLSYTVIGGVVGALGAALSFSVTAKGIITVLSGVFMVIMGLNMLDVFPWLRKLNPRMPKFFGKKVYQTAGKRGPFYVGILNGFMPCGPLQAMQLYALGTGSFWAGALSMFLFSLGTVPLMFGLGAVSSLLSSKFTHKMMKVSALLVIILGMIMLNRGFHLSGYTVGPLIESSEVTGNVAKIEGDIQVITTNLEPGTYPPIVVQKGIPVRWIIKAEEGDLNGCNYAMNLQAIGIENKKLNIGDNIIEFLPQKEGNFVYTCWMGMISSNIEVVSDVTKTSGN